MSIPRLPGENALYRDMHTIIAQASEGMQLGEILAMPNISMLDAMNAIKIGDRRMDSGFGNGHLGNGPTFDVDARLLPDEVCWLLDQTFAAEMAWHQSITLTQSVFTILHVHELGSYNSWGLSKPRDPQRPSQLINLVLAAGVLGMSKCVDLAWREFAKGCVYEHEDWQADKAGVSMMEHISMNDVLSLLKKATDWLQTYEEIESRHRQALLERLQLRKLWLNALHLQLPSDLTSLFAHVAQVRHSIGRVHVLEIPEPPYTSPARMAVDPDVKRKLKFTSPLEAIPLPSMADTWTFFEQLLAGMGDACGACDTRSPVNWEGLLLLTSRKKPSPRYCAFVRATISYTMYDGSRVLGEMEPEWLVDTVLQEMVGLPGGVVKELFAVTASDDVASLMQQSILKFAELLLNYYTTLCHNRPRQRRIFSNALPHWRDLLMLTSDLETQFDLAFPDLTGEMDMLNRLHLIMQYYRCKLAIEVVFAGFELDLYNKSEWLSVLRFASGLLRRQSSILSSLLSTIPEFGERSPSMDYMEAQASVTSSLSSMVYGVILGLLTVDPESDLLSDERQQQNMERRFKWALPENGLGDDLQPDWSGSTRWVAEHVREEQPSTLRAEAMRWFNTAQASLNSLLQKADEIPYLDLCRTEFREFLADLIRTCQKSSNFWHKSSEGSALPRIRWTTEAHPWFLVPQARS